MADAWVLNKVCVGYICLEPSPDLEEEASVSEMVSTLETCLR